MRILLIRPTRNAYYVVHSFYFFSTLLRGFVGGDSRRDMNPNDLHVDTKNVTQSFMGCPTVNWKMPIS